MAVSLFGPKGKGDVSFKAGKNKLFAPEHPLNIDPNAVDLYITIKISDIRDAGGIASGTTGKFVALSRATFVDRAELSAPMTGVDFPTSSDIGVTNGKVNTKTSSTVILNALNQPALPPCTTIELVQALIKDPEGNPFASIGTYLP